MVYMLDWLKKPSGALKTLGQRGEEFAQQDYRQRGYKIIAANEFNKTGKRLGEIDFIAQDRQRIVFVEVKTRTAGVSRFGSGIEAVDGFKQAKILRAVKSYLLSHPQYRGLRPSIDVCQVDYREFDNPQFCAKIIANGVEDWN